MYRYIVTSNLTCQNFFSLCCRVLGFHKKKSNYENLYVLTEKSIHNMFIPWQLVPLKSLVQVHVRCVLVASEASLTHCPAFKQGFLPQAVWAEKIIIARITEPLAGKFNNFFFIKSVSKQDINKINKYNW